MGCRNILTLQVAMVVIAGISCSFYLDDTKPSSCTESVSVYQTNGSSIVSVLVAYGQPLDTKCIADIASTANITALKLNIQGARFTENVFPAFLFNASAPTLCHLELVVRLFDDTAGGGLQADTFDGLENLESLRLEGFESIRWMSPSLFRPLRSLQSLTLVRVGRDLVPYSDLFAALQGLESTPLSQLTLDEIHSLGHKEKQFNFSLLEIPNVTLQSLTLVNNDINSIDRRPSQISTLRSLRYLEFSAYVLTYASLNFGFDTLICMEKLEELRYSFISYPNDNAPNRVARNGIVHIVDSDILKRLVIANASDNCYYDVLIPLSPNLRRLVVNKMDAYKNLVGRPINLCFVTNHVIESLDISWSPIWDPPNSMIGLEALRYIYMRHIDAQVFYVDFFTRMPSLEVILLSENPILRSVIGSDIDARLFRTLDNLTTLNLSNCDIDVIPRREFHALTSLSVLDLSGNRLDSRLDLYLANSPGLRLLDLGANRILQLMENFTEQLDGIADHSGMLTVNLGRNPLSCLCDALGFIRWMKRTRVRFAELDAVTCLHPNGSEILVTAIDLNNVTSDCSVLDEFQNKSSCPCDVTLLGRMSRIVASLADYYCYFPASPSRLHALPQVLDEADGGSNATTKPHWCVGPDPPWYSEVKFIASLTIVGTLVVLLTVAVVLLYRWRKSEKVQWYIALVIGFLLRQPPGSTPSEASTDSSELYSDVGSCSDIFVSGAEDDSPWTRQIIVDHLTSRSLRVLTRDDFEVGAPIVEEVIRSTQRSRVIICVVTDQFLADGWCRQTLTRAYTDRPQSILPVVVAREGESSLSVRRDGDVLLSNLLRTNSPIKVDRNVDGTRLRRFHSDLYERLKFIIETSSLDNSSYRRAFPKICCCKT